MTLVTSQAKRMARERRLLEEFASSTSTFTKQGWSKTAAGELCLKFRLELSICGFEGMLVYPDLFPDVPAYIRPQKFGESWSNHQYRGSGVLCLQYGPDNWDPSITGVDLVRSANTLLWNEVLTAIVPELEGVPSRHSPTVGSYLRNFPRRFIVTRGLRAILANGGAASPVTLKVTSKFNEGCSVSVVTSTGITPVPIDDVPSCLATDRTGWVGWAVLVDSVDAFDVKIDNATLKSSLGPAWPSTEDLGDSIHYLVLHDASGAIRAFLLWEGKEPGIWHCHTVDFEIDQEQRLPAAFGALSEVRIAIVGLGSLGSKIAVSLARAGVRRFTLVDDDVLAPQNLVRNELNWLDVGFSKVGAVERELKRVALGVEVTAYESNIAGQENPLLAAKMCSDVATCTLIIDATANPQAFVVLAALSKRSKTAMVWGEVFAGGVGALMARSRPTLDADALSVRAHINGVLGTMPPVPEGRAANYGLEGGDKVYVASDADVSALAAAMTQFMLDALCAPQDTAYAAAAYLMGYRKYWEFQGPFDTIPIDCSAALRPAEEQEPLSEEEVADLDELNNAMEDGGSATDNGSI